MGYSKTEQFEEADIALFNTCCVRENAEDKLFGKLGELKRIKEQKGTIIAIGGCMMQEEHIIKKITYIICIVYNLYLCYTKLVYSGGGRQPCRSYRTLVLVRPHKGIKQRKEGENPWVWRLL